MNSFVLSCWISVSSVLPSMESRDRIVSFVSLPACFLSCEGLELPLAD